MTIKKSTDNSVIEIIDRYSSDYGMMMKNCVVLQMEYVDKDKVIVEWIRRDIYIRQREMEE